MPRDGGKLAYLLQLTFNVGDATAAAHQQEHFRFIGFGDAFQELHDFACCTLHGIIDKPIKALLRELDGRAGAVLMAQSQRGGVGGRESLLIFADNGQHGYRVDIENGVFTQLVFRIAPQQVVKAFSTDGYIASREVGMGDDVIVFAGNEREIKRAATPVHNQRTVAECLGIIQSAKGQTSSFGLGGKLHLRKSGGDGRLAQLLAAGGGELYRAGDDGAGDGFAGKNGILHTGADEGQVACDELCGHVLNQLALIIHLCIHGGAVAQAHFEASQINSVAFRLEVIRFIAEQHIAVIFDEHGGRDMIRPLP